jgi:small subunit ribosomal protein S20
MPITRSAKKALRVSDRKRVFNIRSKEAILRSVKIVKKTVGTSTDDAMKSLSSAYKAIDKAAKRGFIKKNTASRKKSRLARLVAKAKAK